MLESFVESQSLEFKREYSDGIQKTVIAFANTEGGKLVVGIDDDGRAVGLDNPHDDMLRISNSLKDTIKPDIMMFVSMLIDELDEKPVIVIEVERGTASPYYLRNKGIRPNGVFVRQGASTVSASESAILKMISETSGNRYEVLPSSTQKLSFKEATSYFVKRDLSFEVMQQKTLKLIDNDDTYTNLGYLLSDQSTRSIKLAVFQGNSKRIFRYRREFEGSLLKQLEDVYLLIDKYNATAAYVQGLYRQDIRDYPKEAIREVLLNAIIHREYGLSASTLISLFDDRIEFLTAGSLMKGVTLSDIMLGLSSLRNPNLANIFYRLELIEAYGTGMQKIMEEYEDYAFKPHIELSDNAFKIMLPNINYYSTFVEEKSDVTANEVQLTVQEQKIVELLEKEMYITRRYVEEVYGFSQTTALRILSGLVKREIVEKSGNTRNLKYSLKDKNK